MNTLIKSNSSKFEQTVNEQIKNFRSNSLMTGLERGEFNVEIYHKYLQTIFHQVYHSASTFAMAASFCLDADLEIKQYLIKHADEEKDHWHWIVDDLRSTGYKGPDPLTQQPGIHCQNYISFNYYVAIRYPVARMGIAAVLEGIGGSYSKMGAINISELLGIKNTQLKFLFGHGDTDALHSQEIIDKLKNSNLNDNDWGALQYAAEVAGKLYKDLYNSVLTNGA